MEEMKDKTNQAPPEQPPEAKIEPAAEQAPGELEQLQQRFDQLNDQYLRCLAEYDNYRKRTQREREESERAAKEARLKAEREAERQRQQEVAEAIFQGEPPKGQKPPQTPDPF